MTNQPQKANWTETSLEHRKQPEGEGYAPNPASPDGEHQAVWPGMGSQVLLVTKLLLFCFSKMYFMCMECLTYIRAFVTPP